MYDTEVDDEFVVLVEDELENEDWESIDHADICKAVLKIAQLRSGSLVYAQGIVIHEKA